MIPRSLQSKLMLLTTIAVFVACSLQLYLSFTEHERLYRDFVLNNFDSLSDNMAEESVELISADAGSFEHTSFLLRLDKYKTVKYAATFANSDEPLAIYLNLKYQNEQSPRIGYNQLLNQLKTQTFGMHVTNGDLIAHKLIGDASYPLGHIILIIDYQKPLKESSLELLKKLVPFVLILVAVVSLLTNWIHRLALSPLIRLSDFAKQVSETGDYSARIQITGQDEVAQLGLNIRNMMDTVESEHEANTQQNKQLLSQQHSMERLANYDSLTGLPNRQYFMEMVRVELSRAKRANRNLVVMFCDLDGFKSINDAMGHETGDLLLIEASKIIKDQLREGDIFARLGGDEFLILLPDQPDHITLVNIANRIIDSLTQPITINGWDANISTSIGIANAADCDFNLSTFISNADIAMYQSKSDGRGTYTIFHKKMLEESKRNLLVSNEIINAATNDEFFALYQAKVDQQQKVVGFEALIRWTSPELGAVYPDEFIPIAERNGKICELTQWMIRRVLSDMKELQRAAGTDTVISINLSAHDISQPNLIQFIESQLAEHSVSPTNIEFEITETVYLDNFSAADEFLKKIRNLGCTIALDDFGTGYSSLGYLTRLQLNTLKIDKQFIDNLGLSEQHQLIVQTIIDMAKGLGLSVVAEGVETREQFDYLVDCGCEQIQGYLFARPAPIDELNNIVAKINA